ncbi:MAG: glycine cleavage system aminomethyltransferase GcvT [Gammaproteobacteria bacterium]|nr:glycine cleavage system aminomethyltransferase GcvT [Gammaproteobacteria bacterium]
MSKQTPLYQQHLQAGGQMVDFAGWQMPIHYGSQIQEHQAVRSAAGLFDVSHMTVIDMAGPEAQVCLRTLLANDVTRLQPGGALYSCMLNPEGGVIDDLIVYWLGADQYRLVVNAATHDKDLAWISKQSQKFAQQHQERTDLAMLAVQGPLAIDKSIPLLPKELRDAVQSQPRFTAVQSGDWFIGRTGYTGEDGLEIILPATDAQNLWNGLLQAGVVPAGLGARDTLRLEAGMSLYGQDMDEQVSPLESGLGWTVAWEPQERQFIGRQALEQQKSDGVKRKMVGLRLQGGGVLRAGQKVISEAGEGLVTSGTFSPTLKQSIGLARVPKEIETRCEIEIRGKRVAAEVVKYPFVRNGKAC